VNALKGDALMAILFYLVVVIMAAAGLLACCIGALVTFPLFILSVAIVYRDFFGAGQRY
jgi:uncharacterized membrane protein